MKEDYLKLIDDYFQQQLSAEQKLAFEKRLETEPELAETTAFYVHTKALERDKLLKEKHAEWTSAAMMKPKWGLPSIALGMAASLFLIFGIWHVVRINTQSTERLALAYLQDELGTLPVKMDAQQDSLELGKQLYNEKKYQDAIKIFSKMNSIEAQEAQGLSALQAGDYTLADRIFESLASNTQILNNKATLYLALSLLQQGKEVEGKALLQKIIDENLPGKTTAEKLLD